jgi:glycosyltransferase involved in cell wall biosynthesis
MPEPQVTHVQQSPIVPSSGAATLGELAALIPAWEPNEQMVALVENLLVRGFGLVLIVDDGSSAGCAPVFAMVSAMPRVELLRHATNRGKGRALKTGFEHLLQEHPEMSGVVTADADGQHAPEDIEQVGLRLLRERRPVLGVRRFEGEVPLRSRAGNQVSRMLFGLLAGTRVSDTQTGLRGLMSDQLPELLALEGERYEYEMTMLAQLCRDRRGPVEVPIRTIYLENNRGSHFDPVRDSLRIYRVLLRFAFSTLRRGRRA